MIKRFEYKLLRRIEVNKLSDELLEIAAMPDFIYDLGVAELSSKLANPEHDKKHKDCDDYSKDEKKILEIIGRMLRRKLIIREDRTFSNEGGQNHMFRYFEITDYGYSSMIEYRMKFKFWLPLVISIMSLIISIII